MALIRLLLAAFLLYTPLTVDAGLAKKTANKQGAKGTDARFLQYSRYVLSIRPALFCPLHEASGTTADDIGVNNLDGTYGAGVTLAKASLITDNEGASISMSADGTASVMIAGSGSLLDFTTAGTIMFWALRSGTTSSQRGVWAKDSCAGNRFAVTYDGNGAGSFFLFAYRTGGVPGTVTFSSTAHASADRFLVFSWASDVARYFLDGVLVTSGITFNNPGGNTDLVHLGGFVSGGCSQVGTAGDRIQGVACWSRQLSDAEVLAAWEAGR